MTNEVHLARLSAKFGEREAASMLRILATKSYDIAAYETIIQRLEKDEPLQYILHEAWFYGYLFWVDERVLIPRPETEELVYTILKDIDNQHNTSILDIGTGSGCIPISLALKAKNTTITGLDVSADALVVAQQNATKLGANIRFVAQDILDESLWQQLETYDIIVSNPPYIPPSEMSLMSANVLDYEPHLALFVAEDNPLIFYKKIADFAKQHLNPNGKLYFECNEYNATELQTYLSQHGFSDVQLLKDMEGKERMIRGEVYSHNRK